MRLKGQETSVNVVSSTTGLLTSFGNIKSTSVNFKRETMAEGFLGQTTDRHDDIFNGVSGEIELQEEDASIMELIDRINAASRSRVPGESFTIVTTLRFPNGTRRISIPEAKFGEIPITVGSRKDYVSWKFSFEADDYTTLPTP